MSVYYMHVDDKLVMDTLFDLAKRCGWRTTNKPGCNMIVADTREGTVLTRSMPFGTLIDAFEVIRLLCKGPDKIKLELTPGEAQALWDVTSKVGGDPSKSRRKLIDAIRQKLNGERCITNRAADLADVSGGISFLPK